MALQIALILCVFISAWIDNAVVLAIVGGRDAKIGEFPYQVLLQEDQSNVYYCGGTLIRRQWVLTTAHCVITGLIYAKVGKWNIDTEEKTEQSVAVIKKIIHDNFKGKIGLYDIALLKLKKPVQLNDYVKTIDLPLPNSKGVGNVVISGWGSISTTRKYIWPNILQTTTVHLMDLTVCKRKLEQAMPKAAKDLLETNLCTCPGPGGATFCKGDEGGPMVTVSARGIKVVFGIPSWGFEPCGDFEAPSVYVNVSSFTTWIKKQIASDS